MILTALLLLAAQSADADAASAPAKPAVDPNRRICRREMVTGSNMSRAVCHTRAEWDAIARSNSDAAERLRGPQGVRPVQ